MVNATPRLLYPGKTRYPLYGKLGGTQGRSGRMTPTGTRSPDRPTSSESLYRLSYRPTHYEGYRRFFVGVGGRGVTLATHLHLMPTLGMSRALHLLPPPLPAFIALYREILRAEGMGIFGPGGWRHRGAGQLRKQCRGSRTCAFVTSVHLRNPLLSVSTEIHMECGAGAVNGITF